MTSNPVEAHYTRGDLLQAVLAGLVAAGHDPEHLEAGALGPVEEFHTFGRQGTVALAEAAGLEPGEHVLDVGSGLGGPARHLAREYGCTVTGVDLTAELVAVAAELTRRVGQDDVVTFQQGDATDLPFADDRFDVVWTQHVSMNIADKPALFAEMARVLRPGGRLASFDILAAEGHPTLHFPVPWAEDASTSALASPSETRALLAGAGLAVRVWDDVTAEAAEFYAFLAELPEEPPPLGLHLLIPNMRVKGANLRRGVDEGALTVVRCVAEHVTPT